jgi:glycosyltransferase involved in cell wall biosynthesis
LIAQVQEDGLPVTFHGYLDKRAALALGGVVVVPSTNPDPCPLVVTEALEAGRLLIVSQCGGIPEQVGDAAWLVSPGDNRGLADAIMRTKKMSDAEIFAWHKRAAEHAATLEASDYFENLKRILAALS